MHRKKEGTIVVSRIWRTATRFWDVFGSFDRNETSTIEASLVDQGHLEDEAILSCQHS